MLRGGMGARLLLAGASAVGGSTLLAMVNPRDGQNNSTPRRGSKNIPVLSSPRGVWSGGPAQCLGGRGGGGGGNAVSAYRNGSLGAPSLLRHMVEMSKTTDTETWPWVWLDRHPHGSCHVFVGDAPELLSKMTKAAASDPNGSIVLVRPSGSSNQQANKQKEVEDAVLHQLGVAVLESSVERVDPHEGLLLTRDERIIEFDSMTVMWKHSGGERGEEQEGERLAHSHEELSVQKLSPQAPAAAPAAGGCQRCQQTKRMITPEPRPVAVSLRREEEVVRRTPSAVTLSSSSSSSPPCNGCANLVRRKSLHQGGEGLHHIVQSWRTSTTDTWPWVWLARNPDGPLHVIVAEGKEALEAAKERSNNSPGSNIVVVGRRSNLLNGASEGDYDGQGCAIVDADIEQLDAAHGIVMLTDERVIEFDSLTIIHSGQTAEA